MALAADSSARLADPFLNSVQHLRGLAALSVVCYHLSRAAGREVGILAIGVDLFFVLSGFILWTVTRDANQSAGRFLLRRVVRIAPLYWLATLLLAAAALAWPNRFATVQPEAWHILGSLLFIPHYSPSGEPFPIILVGWTLAYEAVFYLVLAACLSLPPAARLKRLSLVLCALPAVGLMWPPAYQLIANPMLLEIAAGAWLAELRIRGVDTHRKWALALLGAGLVGIILLHLAGGGWSLWRPFLWGPPALLVCAGWIGLEDAGILPRLPPLTWLGAASYSLYLSHDLVIGAVVWTVPPQAPPAVTIACGLALSLAAGLAIWASLERPMTRWLVGRVPKIGGAPSAPA